MQAVRWALAILAVAGLAGSAQAAVAIKLPTASTQALSLIPVASLPVKLAAGPQGSTTISATLTGASFTVTGGSASSYNTTFVNDTGASAVRLRLTLVGSSNLGDCATCNLQLRSGLTQSNQIVVTAGAVAQAQGSLVSEAAGTSWSLWAVASKTGSADKTATLTFLVEALPAAASTPVLDYWNMTANFVV
jgi:hypothetical protein